MLRANIAVWGDSHTASRHHFPQYFQETFLSVPGMDRFNDCLDNKSRGGLELDGKLATSLKNYVEASVLYHNILSFYQELWCQM
jgi:hypothetical protein